MQNGANFGPRRLRNYSTWTRNDQTSSWNTISSYLQRDIKALKSPVASGRKRHQRQYFFPATPLLACNSLPTIICCQTASADLPQRYAVSQTVVQS
ncbi:fimbria/pilus outer membrane usher protein [Escherichia coli]